MASILFVDYQTVIPASWLNDVNAMVYSGTVPAPTLTVNSLVVNTSVSGTGVTSLFASPPSIGNGAPGTGAFTTLSASGSVTLSSGTANGVAYLNGSKVLTTGSALMFDGTNLGIGAGSYFASTTSGYFFAGAGAYTGGIYGSSAGTLANIIAPTAILGLINGSEQMRLTSTGLGIGTSSPTAGFKLDVNGSVRLGNGALTAIDNASSLVSYFGVYDANTTQINSYTGTTPKAIRFRGYTTDYMTLDSSGNLGLGVTPSAWTYKAFEIGYAGNALWGTGSGDLRMSANVNYNSGYKYTTTAAATMYDQSSGSHLWYTAPSGTAGNAISFTQAMTLDASGNLSIGTTSSGGKITAAVANNASFQIAASFTNATNADFNVRIKTSLADIGSSTATPLTFSNGNTEHMRIDSSGNVGIGSSAPTSKLQVVGLPVYANNSAAVAGGLTAGAFYRTGADPDPVCVVH